MYGIYWMEVWKKISVWWSTCVLYVGIVSAKRWVERGRAVKKLEHNAPGISSFFSCDLPVLNCRLPESLVVIMYLRRCFFFSKTCHFPYYLSWLLFLWRKKKYITKLRTKLSANNNLSLIMESCLCLCAVNSEYNQHDK